MNASAYVKKLGVGLDTILTTVLQVFSTVIAFAIQLIVVKSVGKETAGLYYVLLSYLSIAVSLADFGLVAVMMPRMAVASAGSKSPVIKAVLVLRTVTVVCSCFIVGVVMVLQGRQDMAVLFLIGFTGTITSIRLAGGYRQVIDWMWRLKSRTYVAGVVGLFDLVLQLAIVLILRWQFHLDLYGVMIAIALSSIPGFLILLIPMWRAWHIGELLGQKLKPRYYRSFAIAALPIALVAFIGQASAQLETLMIDLLMKSQIMVADYNTATRPLTSAVFLAAAVSFGISPLMSQAYRGFRKDITPVYLSGVAVRITGLLALICGVVCVVFSRQIVSIFGQQYLGHYWVLEWYTVVNAGVFIIVCFDQILLSIGRRTQAFVGAGIFFVVSLTLEAALLKPYGLQGLLAAKLTGVLCVISFQLYVLGPTLRSGALNGFLRLTPAAALVCVVLYATAGLAPELRIAVSVATLAVGVVLGRTVTGHDLRTLRSVQVS